MSGWVLTAAAVQGLDGSPQPRPVPADRAAPAEVRLRGGGGADEEGAVCLQCPGTRKFASELDALLFFGKRSVRGTITEERARYDWRRGQGVAHGDLLCLGRRQLRNSTVKVGSPGL